MSIELKRARRRRLRRMRALRQRQGYRSRRDAERDADVIAAAVEALPTGWSAPPAGWLLAPLGFFGLDAVEEAVLIALVTGEPLLLVGRHGTAKTALCCRLAEVLDLCFHAYDAAKALFEDVIGFPDPASLAQGHVSYVPTPMSLWDKELILVDELSRAQPQMQNKWLEVIRSHRLMGRPLPRLRHVLAAMNPTDYLGAVPLDEALLSRFSVVVRMPEVAHMGEATARQVIAARSADDAPLLGDALRGAPGDGDTLTTLRRRLRRRLTVARRQLAAVEARWGEAVISYVHEVALHLAERDHALDGRRLGMVRRNLLVALALAAGERALEPAPPDAAPDARSGAAPAADLDELASRVGRVLVLSLPFVADGRPGPSAELLGTIHRAAFDQAFEPAADARPGAPRHATASAPALTRSGRRQLLAYRQHIHDLPLEQHYQVVNEVLHRAQDALPDRLSAAWEGLRALGDVVRDHAASVPWEVTEHLLDGLALRFGLVETAAPALVLLGINEAVQVQRPGPARLARQCLAHSAQPRHDGHDEAASLYRRLRDAGGAP